MANREAVPVPVPADPGRRLGATCAGRSLSSPAEDEVVEARRRIHWHVLGIDADGNHIIEVANTGIRGATCAHGRLPIQGSTTERGDPSPDRAHWNGQTGLVDAACYKDLVRRTRSRFFRCRIHDPKTVNDLQNCPAGRDGSRFFERQGFGLSATPHLKE